LQGLLLMLPGPMQVPDAVAEAARKPLFFHRSPRFLEFQDALRSRIRPLFGTNSAEIVFLSACGTGAMESAVVNLTSPGQEVLVMTGGVFAQRWTAIGEAFGLSVHPVEVDWRSGATVDDVARAMERWPKASVVFLTWSESSTGVLIDLEPIGAAVREQGKYLVADAVSGLAVSPLEMDSWNVDTVVSGSQKGLMMPPGLGVVAIGQRAMERSRSSTSPRLTWDWAPYLDRVPVTPPLSLMHQLNAALDVMDSLGPGGVYVRRREVAQRIRDLVTRLGLDIYATRIGDGITAVVAPDGMDITRFRGRLEDDFSILIAGGQGRLNGEVFRIGHVGHLTDEELEYFCDSFEKALKLEMGLE
jgi:aspartate aminotransferase-like enzyme